MTEQIHMGHGQMVDVVQIGHESWELVFSEAGVESYKAPPLDEIGADLIDIHGRLHPLEISAGSSISSVTASGHVHDAYRIRVRVVHGNHYHTREGLIGDVPPAKPVTGPNGGSLVMFDEGLAVELTSVDPETWALYFSKDGVAIDPPAADTVIVQAIGPRAEDYQIRNLTTGTADKSLVATGKIKDGIQAYISLTNGETVSARSIPVIA